VKRSDQIKEINDFMVERELPVSRTNASDKRIRKYIYNAIYHGEQINLVNIICPGYIKDRTIGIEDFSFGSLSDDVSNCPNVTSMIDKFICFSHPLEKRYGKSIKINKTIILADTAILNYHLISRKQKVKKTLDIFYSSIKKYLHEKTKNEPAIKNINILRMSEMGGSFRKLPIEGYAVRLDMYKMKNIGHAIKSKVRQYSEILIQDRSNPRKNKNSSFANLKKVKIIERSKLEVIRFLYEYGLAGKEIFKQFPNAIVTFTEPSGNSRGYFYNAFLKRKEYLPVIYLP
jgi:hypothetical protein